MGGRLFFDVFMGYWDFRKEADARLIQATLANELPLRYARMGGGGLKIRTVSFLAPLFIFGRSFVGFCPAYLIFYRLII